jgi:flagellar assembly protein FliH
MKWSEPISFNRPLHDVRMLANSPSQDWSEHLREREQAAYERGRHEGEDSLRKQLIDQRNELGGALTSVIESLRKVVPQLVQETESALIQLALESAQKIVAGLPITAKMVDAVVREALQQVEDTGEVTVQLHPDDLALLRKQKTKTLDSAPESGPLRFVSSAEVTRGGCLVQTRFGIIDARRETKFEQLQEAAAA